MKTYEILYSGLRLLEHPLYNIVHKKVKSVIHDHTRLLDVGGRTSPQTVGLNCPVTISELPRESDIQESLNLGATPTLSEEILRRRSNIHSYIYDDMTKSGIPNNSFDVVMAIEVLEHVLDDESFVRSVAQKLVSNGIFVMSTPNGDFVVNNNPDHIRHYKRKQLLALLKKYFQIVDIEYSVIRRPFFHVGSWLENKIGGKFGAMIGGIFYMLSRLQARVFPPRNRESGTLHLVAFCTQPISN